MSKSYASHLQYLQAKIQHITMAAQAFEHEFLSKASFDKALFKASYLEKPGYLAYIDEVNQLYEHLADLIAKDQVNEQAERIHYVADKLINQLSALWREISAKQQSKQSKHAKRQSDNQPAQCHLTLFEKHAQHLDYLRRLQIQHAEIKQQLALNSTPSIQQKLTIFNQRIERCKQAITELEIRIEKQTIHTSMTRH